jgi:polyisoprenoid-binding protein YceI
MTAETGGSRQPGANTVALARDGALAGRWKLDPQASKAGFAVRHLWRAITVHGRFEQLDGEGSVGPDGTATGQVVIDAGSLNTGNKQRDKHRRSADFFDVEQHPRVVLTVNSGVPAGEGRLAVDGTLEAAGVSQPVSFTAHVIDATADTVTLRAELSVDRSRFEMTWSPLRMASMPAPGSVTARFTRLLGKVPLRRDREPRARACPVDHGRGA